MWVEMSELISGKEAKVVWANGDQLQVAHITMKDWEVLTDNYMLSVFDSDSYVFRLKTRTITINNIEVPAPFEPKLGERYYVLQPCNESGWMGEDCVDMEFENTWSQFGAWRTEDEIKQVVAALKKIFVINNQ